MAGNKNQKYAVEKYGVEDKVLKLYKEGVPATRISKILKEEDDVVIASYGINRYLAKFKEIDTEKSKLEEVKKFEAVVIDYKMELTNILEEVKSVKNMALEQGDLKIYEKLVGRLYQGIQLIGEFMGDIKQKNSIDINIVIDEITKKSFLDNKDGRSLFSHNKIIDVENEIFEEDKEHADRIRN